MIYKQFGLLSSKTLFTILTLLFCSAYLVGQNLVLNGDFESYEECPTEEGHWEGYATGWSTFFGTPDYLNCEYYGNNPTITPQAHSGVGLVSCVWFDSDYANPPNVEREYLIGSLNENLKADSSYYVYFWIYIRNQAAQVQSQHVGLIKPGDYDNIGEYSISTEIALQDNEFLPVDQWYKISGCYTAKGGESQIVLGNFLTDEETVFVDTGIGFTNFNFIDDVGVYSIPSLIPEDTLLLVGQSYDFDQSIGQSYEIDDEPFNDNFLQFNEVGTYSISVWLEECGEIGSFTIKVINCDEAIDNLSIDYLEDQQYCYTKGIEIELPNLQGIFYKQNNVLISENELTLDNLGIDTITTAHQYCGELHTSTFEGIDCDTIEFVQDLICFEFPNAFSPNYDGYNDNFKPFGACEILNYNIIIFDRWGNQVHLGVDPIKGWDGTYRDTDCSNGVYVYFSEIEFQQEATISIQYDSGDVLILR